MRTYYVAPPNPRRWWNRFFTCLQLCSIGLIGWWYPYRHVPHAGKAVGVVAVAAAIMSFQEGMRSWRKFIWIIILGCLLFTELRAIDKDRDNARSQEIQDSRESTDHFNNVLAHQDREFQATSTALTKSYEKSQANFGVTLRQTQGVLATTQSVAKLAKSTLENLSGGDSFAFLWPALSYGNTPTWNIHNAGNQPLTGVVAKIYPILTGEFAIPLPRSVIFQRTPPIDVQTLPKHWGELLPVTYPVGPVTLNANGFASYLIFVSAQNGGVTENIQFRRSSNGQSLDYRIDVYVDPVGPARKGDQVIDGVKIRKVMSRDWTPPGATQINP